MLQRSEEREVHSFGQKSPHVLLLIEEYPIILINTFWPTWRVTNTSDRRFSKRSKN